MNILFVGPVDYGSTSNYRYQSIKKLSKFSDVINTNIKKNFFFIYRIYLKFLIKIGFPMDITNANQNIVNKIKKQKPDILWLDKANTIKPKTLQIVKKISPQTKIIGYSPDYMTRHVNRSFYFVKSLKYYDFFFTTKSYGVKELKKLGAKKVFFVNNSYDPNSHKKIILSHKEKQKFKSQVGFVGTWEKDRARYIRFIASSGIQVKWWGGVSNRHLLLNSFYNHANLIKYNKTLIGKNYTRAINSFDIALCFLRKDNKDLQTTRSVEITACGTFMLAERTKEHQQLFKEGKEAEFFSSETELIQKIKYYLKNKKKKSSNCKRGKKKMFKFRLLE